MLLGSFEVPEIRLVPNAVTDIKIIYDNVQTESAKSKDLASYLGYSNATATRFYLRLKTMVAYGLLEGRGSYKVSELGKSLAYPENDKQQDTSRTKAVLNVGLWKELHKKFPQEPPKDNFWVHLKNATGIEPKQAKEIQSQIFKWYSEDISYVSDNMEPDQHLTQSSTQYNQMSQQMESSKLNNSLDVEILSFDKYQITLPKGDLKKEWDKLKKYMDIKLEGYEYKEPEVKLEDLSPEDQELIKDNYPQGD